MTSGSCECGAVRYSATGPMRSVTFCHCSQCRRLSGHFWAATSVPDDRLSITGTEALVWYRSSATAQRGFCGRCGSTLFYRPDGQGRMAIGAGTLHTPSGLRAEKHIFVADKGDYYDIADGLPQHQSWEDAT